MILAPTAGVAARAGYNRNPPAFGSPSQDTQRGIIDDFQRTGQPDRPDGVQMILTLGGPIIATDPHPGPGNLVHIKVGLLKSGAGNLQQNLGKAAVANPFPIARPSRSKPKCQTGFIRNQRVGFGSANIHAKKIPAHPHSSPNAMFLRRAPKNYRINFFSSQQPMTWIPLFLICFFIAGSMKAW